MQGAAKYPQELWPMTGTIATTIVLVVSPSLNADDAGIGQGDNKLDLERR
jgi:hypothetical protein